MNDHATREARDADPLPYIQFDRSVLPVVEPLAGVMRVSSQHVKGSLLSFWELCGKPKELERIVVATPVGEEPSVVLSDATVRLRWQLASGAAVEPSLLVELNLLEPLGHQQYRVRGMSRYFKPIIKRLKAREAAAKGGKRSAAVRAEAHGTAQPPGGKGSVRAQAVAQAVAQAPSEAERKREPKRNGSDDGSVNRSGTEVSGQRTADSGHASSSYDDDGAAPPPSPGVAFFERFQSSRLTHGWTREEPPSARELDEFIGDAAERLGDTVDGALVALEVATRGYARDRYWRERALPWAGFVLQWHRHVARASAGAA